MASCLFITAEIAAILQTGAFAGQKLRVIVEAEEVKASIPLHTEEFDTPERAKHEKQIDALAMRGPKKAKSKDSWLNTVGKHPNDSSWTQIFADGAKIRES